MSHATSSTSALDLIAMKQRGEPIAVVTAYDWTSGRIADQAGVDVVVVGDSIAVKVLGGTTTLSATIDEMVLFARAAASGARHPLVVVDLPFGTFEHSDGQALAAATRLVKEGAAQAVKVEGGGTTIERAAAIAGAGIPVMAHLVPHGPLWVSHRWRASAAELGRQTLDDALALERAGCFSVMLECVPDVVATAITGALTVPTIGYGSGAGCDGQVLSLHEVLGLDDGELSPYSKRYADIASIGRDACARFVGEVRQRLFPPAGQAEPMSTDEQHRFAEAVVSR